MDICLVDSIYKDGDNISAIYDAIGTGEELTSFHGSWIRDILAWGAPQAEILCYRVIDEEGEYRRFDLLKTFSEVKTSNANLVNLSLGSYKPNCDGNCRECKAAQQLADSGLTVVAAAGNEEQQNGNCCPSKNSSVLSVAGFQDLCEFEPYFANRAIWVKKSEPEPDEDTHTDVICCHRGCSENIRQCKRRSREEWNGNVPFGTYEPDVLAPVHHSRPGDDEVYFDQGTSFSAGYLVGGLAKLYGGKNSTSLPAPRKLIKLIQQTPNKSSNDIPYLDLAYLRAQVEE